MSNVDGGMIVGAVLVRGHNSRKFADQIQRFDTFFRFVHIVRRLIQLVELADFGKEEHKVVGGNIGKNFQVAFCAKPRLDIEQKRKSVHGTKFVAVTQEKFIRKNDVKDMEIVLVRLSMPDIGRDDEKIAAGDGITVVFDIVQSRPFRDDVDLIKFMRVHLDGKIVFMKITKQHDLFFLFFGQKIVRVQGFLKRINIVVLDVYGLCHIQIITLFYKKSN